MRYLLDTHALLWFLGNSEELSDRALGIIENEPEIHVSVASLWEIAIKQSIGKMKWPHSPSYMKWICDNENISVLPVLPAHLDRLQNLPKFHNDPFDRLLICQAQAENLVLVTHDSIVPKYPVETIW